MSRRSVLVGVIVAALAGLTTGRALPSAPAKEPTGASTPAATAAAAPKRYQVPVTISQPARGPADALVTLVHYCDFQSAECRAAAPVLDRALAAHARDLRLVFRHYAAPDPASMLAHEFAQLAHDRGGRFWGVRERLLRTPSAPDLGALEQIASEVGLNWADAQQALAKHSYARHVIADRTFAGMFEVAAVPATFVNGRKLEGVPSAAALEALIGEELAHARALVAGGVGRSALYAALTKDGFFVRPSLARP